MSYKIYLICQKTLNAVLTLSSQYFTHLCSEFATSEFINTVAVGLNASHCHQLQFATVFVLLTTILTKQLWINIKDTNDRILATEYTNWQLNLAYHSYGNILATNISNPAFKLLTSLLRSQNMNAYTVFIIISFPQ